MTAVLRVLAGGLAVLCTAAPALAQDSQLEAARGCTQVKDSLERLACYDRALAAPAPSFGSEQVEHLVRKERDEAQREIEATVAAVTPIRRDLVRITLDNGQVWDQQQASSRFDIKPGDTLRIKKGAMGSYRMARVSNGTSGWVEARRRD